MNAIWNWIGLALAVLVILGIALVRVGRRAPTKFIGIGAWIALVGTVLATSQKVVALIWGSIVDIRVTTSSFWPTVPPKIQSETDATASYVGGGFHNAEVSVSGLSAVARSLLIGEVITSGLVVSALAVLVIRLVKAIDGGNAFSDALAKRATATGWIVFFGGVATAVFGQVGNWRAQTELFGWQRNLGWPENMAIANPWMEGQDFHMERFFGVLSPDFSPSIELWPLVIAAALLITARMLKSGQELTADLDGLV